MSVNIAHDMARNCFQTSVDGQTAALEYRRDDPVVEMTRVVVPPPIEGRGIAGELTKAALDWARSEQLQVVPTCPYVAGWMQRHPDYLELRAERH